MNKPIRWIQSYLLYSLPFVLICMVWGTIRPEQESSTESMFFTKALWELLSWNLMLWFSVLFLSLILLVFLPEAREKTLKRLANLKERDEREQFITGQASRAAYISSLSLMILLLFLSVFSLNIYRVPEKEAIHGKTGTVAIGFGFSLLDKPHVEMSPERKVIFESKEIPLSKAAIILILILWQLAIFNFTARKENLKGLHE